MILCFFLLVCLYSKSSVYRSFILQMHCINDIQNISITKKLLISIIKTKSFTEADFIVGLRSWSTLYNVHVPSVNHTLNGPQSVSVMMKQHTGQTNTSAMRRLPQQWACTAPSQGHQVQRWAGRHGACSQTHLWRRPGGGSNPGRRRRTQGLEESGHDTAGSKTAAPASDAWSLETSPPAGNWNSPQ